MSLELHFEENYDVDPMVIALLNIDPRTLIK